MIVIDLFSGVGGFSLGFKQAGFDITIAIENDESIAESYVKNHPEVYMLNEDISNVSLAVFNKINGDNTIIIGGPPCQGFSQKGSRNILDDERNYLFKQFYKIVDYIKPRYFIMENVPNMLTVNNGYFKKQIINLFSKLGYSIDYGILNAVNFGVPQRRKRAFILGKLGNKTLNLPKFEKNKIVTVEEAIGDLAFLESGEGKEQQEYKFEPQSDYQKNLRKGANILYNHVATAHSNKVIERLKMIPVGSGREVLPKKYLTKSIYSGTWSRLIKNEPAVTITTRFDTPSSGRFTHPTLNRAITVREAARLQSFPDTFIFYGNKSSKMKQVGNAVPPLLAKRLAEIIKKDISLT